MKLYIDSFYHNAQKDVADVITSVRYNETPEGIIRILFKTVDRFLSVDDEYTMCSDKYSGYVIAFSPLSWGEAWGEDDWVLSLVLETSGRYVSNVIQREHEYLWVLTPYDIVYHGYDDMDQLELINGEQE